MTAMLAAAGVQVLAIRMALAAASGDAVNIAAMCRVPGTHAGTGKTGPVRGAPEHRCPVCLHAGSPYVPAPITEAPHASAPGFALIVPPPDTPPRGMASRRAGNRDPPASGMLFTAS